MDSNEKNKKDLEKVPLIYLYIYKRLAENFKIRRNISYRNLIHNITRMTYHMPIKYHDIVIRELVDFGLLNKISGGKSPSYDLNPSNYESLILDLNNLQKSSPNNRLKILKSGYKKILKKVEEEETFDQKYKLLECNYVKLLRKLELKKLEGSHYW